MERTAGGTLLGALIHARREPAPRRAQGTDPKTGRIRSRLSTRSSWRSRWKSSLRRSTTRFYRRSGLSTESAHLLRRG
jgi:hypothetical protein